MIRALNEKFGSELINQAIDQNTDRNELRGGRGPIVMAACLSTSTVERGRVRVRWCQGQNAKKRQGEEEKKEGRKEVGEQYARNAFPTWVHRTAPIRDRYARVLPRD